MAGKWEERFQEFIESLKKKKISSKGGEGTVPPVQFYHVTDLESKKKKKYDTNYYHLTIYYLLYICHFTYMLQRRKLRISKGNCIF